LLKLNNSVVDIREQFHLLPLEETIVLADELGFKHPTDAKTNEPVVLATDFLLNSRQNDWISVCMTTIIYEKNTNYIFPYN